MSKIRRVLVSVSDKSGLVPFVRGLMRWKPEVVSTGGTAALLRQQGVPVREIARFTGFPEILFGRVKTLHPKVHGAILADRRSREHLKQVKHLKLELIDLVVVNLYPFESAAGKRGGTLEELIEQIDVGGVALLRSAAKNFRSVGVVCRPSQYVEVLQELKERGGTLSEPTRLRLASEAFAQTAYYDALIHQVLAHREKNHGPGYRNGTRDHGFPDHLVVAAAKRQVLRYGENPHQSGVWYEWPQMGGNRFGLGAARQLHGKELSFNNLLDLDAALEIVSAFERPCAAVVKHTNPCGVACANRLAEAFRKAYAGDPLSVFGGIVGFNRVVEKVTAREILAGGFLECLVAPGYRPEALRMLKARRNLRILQAPLRRGRAAQRCVELKQVGGGLLVQRPDEFRRGPARWRVVSRARPTEKQRRDLVFAWKVARFVRSNAIVIAQDEQTVGIGMGLTSRVDSVHLAVRKAGARARGAALASDGFFPKPDGPQAAVRAGVKAIAQPGGSRQDPEVIRVADKTGAAMLMTGERHFRH